MDEDATEALVLEIGHRVVDEFGRHDLVPDEERRRAVLFGGQGELCAQAFEIFGCRTVTLVRSAAAGHGEYPQKRQYRPS